MKVSLFLFFSFLSICSAHSTSIFNIGETIKDFVDKAKATSDSFAKITVNSILKDMYKTEYKRMSVSNELHKNFNSNKNYKRHTNTSTRYIYNSNKDVILYNPTFSYMNNTETTEDFIFKISNTSNTTNQSSSLLKAKKSDNKRNSDTITKEINVSYLNITSYKNASLDKSNSSNTYINATNDNQGKFTNRHDNKKQYMRRSKKLHKNNPTLSEIEESDSPYQYKSEIRNITLIFPDTFDSCSLKIIDLVTYKITKQTKFIEHLILSNNFNKLEPIGVFSESSIVNISFYSYNKKLNIFSVFFSDNYINRRVSNKKKRIKDNLFESFSKSNKKDNVFTNNETYNNQSKKIKNNNKKIYTNDKANISSMNSINKSTLEDEIISRKFKINEKMLNDQKKVYQNNDHNITSHNNDTDINDEYEITIRYEYIVDNIIKLERDHNLFNKNDTRGILLNLNEAGHFKSQIKDVYRNTNSTIGENESNITNINLSDLNTSTSNEDTEKQSEENDTTNTTNINATNTNRQNTTSSVNSFVSNTIIWKVVNQNFYDNNENFTINFKIPNIIIKKMEGELEITPAMKMLEEPNNNNNTNINNSINNSSNNTNTVDDNIINELSHKFHDYTTYTYNEILIPQKVLVFKTKFKAIYTKCEYIKISTFVVLLGALFIIVVILMIYVLISSILSN